MQHFDVLPECARYGLFTVGRKQTRSGVKIQWLFQYRWIAVHIVVALEPRRREC